MIARLSGIYPEALANCWRLGRIIALLTGFFDESGEHLPVGKKALRRLTLGGFYAPVQAVQSLCVEWRAALDAESLGSFHMKDIASDEHNYADWSLGKQRRLDRFVDILCSHATQFSAFTYAVINPGRAFEDAYRLALTRAFITASTLSYDNAERANVVFAQTHEIKSELIHKHYDRLQWGEFLDGWGVKQSNTNPPLQAAEIVARGMRRFMKDGVVTESFKRILASGVPLRTWPENATEHLI